MRVFVRLTGIPLLLFAIAGFSQQSSFSGANYVGLDFSLGYLGNSNSNFPEHGLQKSVFLAIGKQHSATEKPWAYYLKNPKTGLLLGFSDLGNREALGYGYSLLPYIELPLLSSKTDRIHLSVAFGASYLDRLFDRETNPDNKAVSTRLNWNYRSYVYYNLVKRTSAVWRLGLGYLHHSNGHTRKPNRGYNTFLLGLSAEFSNREFNKSALPASDRKPLKNTDWFYTGRFGIGQNSFSDVFNSKKEVFSAAISAGKIINKTFKFGGGLYYNFYGHYYDYIVNEETLIRTQEPGFIDHPIKYASNLGVFGSAEVLMGHVGMEFNLGVNFFKPFYKIDWQLNEGFTTFRNGKENIVLGDLDAYYQIKRYVSSRMGLKYYVFDTTRSLRHNIFIGAFINANLGQADFSEFTVGYERRLGF